MNQFRERKGECGVVRPQARRHTVCLSRSLCETARLCEECQNALLLLLLRICILVIRLTSDTPAQPALNPFSRTADYAGCDAEEMVAGVFIRRYCFQCLKLLLGTANVIHPISKHMRNAN